MEEGRQVSRYQQRYVFQVLEAFNRRHRQTLSEELAFEIRALDKQAFIDSVGTGQPSLLHLAKFIHSTLQPQIKQEIKRLEERYGTARTEERQELHSRLEQFGTLTREVLIDRFLQPGRNPEIVDPNIPRDDADVPALLHTSPRELLDRLSALHSGSHFILSLSNLSIQDTLELLLRLSGQDHPYRELQSQRRLARHARRPRHPCSLPD